MAREVYLTHYILQSGNWIKVAEYACVDRSQAAARIAAILELHPNDVTRFEIR